MIRFNSNAGETIFILLGAFCFLGLGLFLTLHPDRGAQLVARIVAKHPKAFGWSDRQLNPGVVAYVRAFGAVLVAMFGLALCLVLGLFLLNLFLTTKR